MITGVSNGSLSVGLLRVVSRKAKGKKAGNTSFQNLCRAFLHGYAGYSYAKLNRLTGPQISEAARLICIRDGHSDWIAFVSDWYEGHQK